MTVKELKHYLSFVDDDCDVKIKYCKRDSVFDHSPETDKVSGIGIQNSDGKKELRIVGARLKE